MEQEIQGLLYTDKAFPHQQCMGQALPVQSCTDKGLLSQLCTEQVTQGLLCIGKELLRQYCMEQVLPNLLCTDMGSLRQWNMMDYLNCKWNIPLLVITSEQTPKLLLKLPKILWSCSFPPIPL